MIPATVSLQLAALADAVSAAGDLSRAPALQVSALVGQGRVVVGAIETALSANGLVLDATEPTGQPLALVAALVSLSDAGSDASTLSDMRGLVGRAVLNLQQAGI